MLYLKHEKVFYSSVCRAVLFAAYPAAFAEPTALPDPEASPSAHPAALPSASPQASASTLISYGSTGEMVVRIQLRLRELGYFDYKPTGNFQSMTVEATKILAKPDGCQRPPHHRGRHSRRTVPHVSV